MGDRHDRVTAAVEQEPGGDAVARGSEDMMVMRIRSGGELWLKRSRQVWSGAFHAPLGKAGSIPTRSLGKSARPRPAVAIEWRWFDPASSKLLSPRRVS